MTTLLSPRPRILLLLALLLGLAGLSATHYLASLYQNKMVTEQLKEASSKADLQIDSELDKFKQIPALLSHDPRLLSYFDDSLSDRFNDKQLNPLLLDWSKQTHADTIYVHDLSGTVVASSNYLSSKSFVGENFAFRPYFKQALLGDEVHYVALGARSNVRGYFLSTPLYHQQRIVGVLTVKVSLENIEQLLTRDGYDILVLDTNQVVFLSSNPNWLYHSLLPLSPTQQQQIASQRQYGSAKVTMVDEFKAPLRQYLSSLDIPPENTAHLANSDLIKRNTAILPNDQLTDLGKFKMYPHSTSDGQYQVVTVKRARQDLLTVLQFDVIFVIIYCLTALIAWSWRQTYRAKVELSKVNQNLEQTVSKRTHHLQQSNQQLQQTLFQYQESQSKLKKTEQELTQAAKLAVLGELSASINHEINQPLAALKTYSENSLKLLKMDKTELVEGNLEKMITLNNTIAEIISRLKVFTRKVTKQEHHIANVHRSVNNATSILSNLLIKQGITLRLTSISDDLQIAIHPVELEQVLVNLIHNAAQALQGHSNPQIGLEVLYVHHSEECASHNEKTAYNPKITPSCNIRIWDNGPGMATHDIEQVFDPFFTTKPEGLGLGLSISKRIIEAYHGAIIATQREPSGMVFSIQIPLSVTHNR